MPELQSTSRTQTSRVREATFGVTPASPAWKTMRVNAPSLNANPQTIATEEIRADRQVTDLILVGQQAQGDIAGELAFNIRDDELEEALQGTWSTQPRIVNIVADTQISDVSTTALTVASGGAAFVTGALTLTEGFATPANNKLARVVSSTGTTITYGAATFTAEGTVPLGASVRVVGFEGVTGDIVATITGGNALTSTTLNFTTLDIQPGDWLKIGSAVTNTGFATPALNDWVRVSAVAAQRLSLGVVPAGWVADAGPGKTIRVFQGERLRNSSTKRSNTFERQFLDHSPVTYEYLRGMTLNTMQIDLQSQQIVKVSMNYMGKDGVVQTSRFAGSTDVAAPTYDVFNASSNVGNLSFDGSPVTGPNFIMQAQLNISNNLRMQNAVASIGAVGTGNGEFTVTGQLRTYFGTPAVYQKVLDNSRTSFWTRMGRGAGNNETLLFDLPSIKLASGAPEVAGKNQDVPLNANFQALMDPVLLYTMAAQRYWYMPIA